MASTSSSLQRLILSATDLKNLTSGQKAGEPWPDALVEDYLNILRDLVLLADSIDEVSEDTIFEIRRISQGLYALHATVSKQRSMLSKLSTTDKKLEQLIYAW
jgi:hypothetical protein